MNKTISIPSQPIRSWHDFWKCIFFGREKTLAEKAEKLYILIKDGKVEGKNWKIICEEFGMKQGQYYHILKSMRTLGMVDYSYSTKKYEVSENFYLILKVFENYAK